jgi:hypothetical protein
MTEQNKQPPTEAGEAVAVVDADAPCGIALTDAGAKLPIGTKLYTSQTTATQAAVAAARLEYAEVCDQKAIFYEKQLPEEFDETYMRGLAVMARNIANELMSIPAEANAALEKICMENVARKVDTERYCRELDEVDLRAIVRDVLNKNRREV